MPSKQRETLTVCLGPDYDRIVRALDAQALEETKHLNAPKGDRMRITRSSVCRRAILKGLGL